MPLESVTTSLPLDEALRTLSLAVELSKEQDAVAPGVPALPAEAWKSISIGVVREHFDEALVGKNPEPALDVLQTSGCLAALLPEVEGLVGFGDGEWRHKDVWKHTKLVVKQAVPRLEVRWGALLHDIGKPRTRRLEDDGSVTFYGHAELGAAMFRRKVRARLAFEPVLAERIHFLILQHLRASQYEPSWTDSAVRRFYTQMGDGLRDLLDLSRADITTKRPEKRRRGVQQVSDLSRRIKALQAIDAKVPALPKGIGTMLTDVFGVPPSKRLGEIRGLLESHVEDGLIERGQDTAYYEAWMRDNRARYGLD